VANGSFLTLIPPGISVLHPEYFRGAEYFFLFLFSYKKTRKEQKEFPVQTAGKPRPSRNQKIHIEISNIAHNALGAV
jgi:hypothetical protein